MRRDRLLAALTLIAGIGLALGTPFALKAGAEFFPLTTAALVIAIALVPVLEWLERHRVPSALARAYPACCCSSSPGNIALAAIIVPATEFAAQVARSDRPDPDEHRAGARSLFEPREIYVSRAVAPSRRRRGR